MARPGCSSAAGAAQLPCWAALTHVWLQVRSQESLQHVDVNHIGTGWVTAANEIVSRTQSVWTGSRLGIARHFISSAAHALDDDAAPCTYRSTTGMPKTSA